MSLMDIAQLLGNLGEFIGAFVIVATLIYLAMQVRQNTNALHAQSRQAVLSSAQAGLLAMIENPDVHLSIVKTDSLTPEEHVKLHYWLHSFMRLRQFSWLQYRSGVIDEVQWSTELHVIQTVLQANRPRTWWNTSGRKNFGTAFVEFIDDVLRDQPTTNETFELMADWTNR